MPPARVRLCWPLAAALLAVVPAARAEPQRGLVFLGGPPPPQPPPAPRPRLFLLAIGVSEYQDREMRLRYAAKDARDFAAAFTERARGLYEQIDQRVLTDQDASRGAILDGLEWLQGQATAADVTVIYLAGHGLNEPRTGRYHFLPSDGERGAFKRSMISEGELRDTLTTLPGKVLVFLDTCRAGSLYRVAPGLRGPAADLSGLLRELTGTPAGMVVFAASTGDQPSREGATWGNGAFTLALVEGLRCRADYAQSGQVSVSMLELYLGRRVRDLTGGVQTPTVARPGSTADFPLVLCPKGAPLATAERGVKAPPPRSLWRSPWLWASIGAGVAGTLGLGLGLGLRHAEAQNPVFQLSLVF